MHESRVYAVIPNDKWTDVMCISIPMALGELKETDIRKIVADLSEINDNWKDVRHFDKLALLIDSDNGERVIINEDADYFFTLY